MDRSLPGRNLTFYFSFLKEHADFLRMLYHHDLIELANRKFSVLIAETMPRWSEDPAEQEYRSRFVCAGIEAIAGVWMKHECRDSVSRIVGIARKSMGMEAENKPAAGGLAGNGQEKEDRA